MPETLYGKLKNESKPLSRHEIRTFTLMMISGIQYLHAMEVMHRVMLKKVHLILFSRDEYVPEKYT